MGINTKFEVLKMSSRKTSGEKIRYMKRLKQNAPPPTWVTVRTNRKVRTNPKRRNWRVSKLKL